MIDESTIIAIASIVLAAASPVITGAVNASSQRKMYVAQRWADHAQQSISDYLKYASVQVDNPTGMRMEEYDKAYGEVFLYAPERAWDDMKKLNDLIHSKVRSDEAVELFNRIVSVLASDNSAILKNYK